MRNAIDDFQTALKFTLDWFVTSKMIKNLHNVLFADDNVIFFDEDSSNVTFSSDEMGVLNVDPNNIKLDDVNFYEDDLEIIIHVSPMVCPNRPK